MAPTPATDRMWSRAFASQALSDLDVRSLLASSGAAKCHRLHFLQMAAEKICKAFLIRSNGYAVLKLTHNVIEKSLPLAVFPILARERHSSTALRARMKSVKLFGREIELLSPSCNAAGVREDNSEYPWLISPGSVAVPHEYSYPNLNDEGTEFIALTRLMQTAAETYLV